MDDNPLNAGVNYSFRNNKDEFEVYDFNQISAYINYRHSVSESDFILPGYIFNSKHITKTLHCFPTMSIDFLLIGFQTLKPKHHLTLNAEYLIKQYSEKYDFEGYLNEATQLKLKANIGQSLSDLTGINAYIVYRKNLSDGSRYLISDSLVYYEEEIFNDIYSYDGIETGLGFKHYFNENIELSLEAKYLDKKLFFVTGC